MRGPRRGSRASCGRSRPRPSSRRGTFRRAPTAIGSSTRSRCGSRTPSSSCGRGCRCRWSWPRWGADVSSHLMDAALPQGAGPAALEARRLSKRFGSVEALRGLSFSVAPAELYGLVGPDGAGKTTAIRALAGLLVPDEGEALVLGRDARRGGPEVRESLGLMPQQYSLYRDLTVAEN